MALTAIAANNSAVINGAQNVFDSRRKLKMSRTAVEENEAKFTSKQKQVLAINQCLFLGATAQVRTFHRPCTLFIICYTVYIFLVLSFQADQCRMAIDQLKKAYPEGLVEVLLLQAALDFKANKLEEALSTLASAKPECALTAGLAALQLLLEKREFDRAIAQLESMLKQNFRLGLLGSLASIHSSRGERERAIALVNQAMDQVNKTKVRLPHSIASVTSLTVFHFRSREKTTLSFFAKPLPSI